MALPLQSSIRHLAHFFRCAWSSCAPRVILGRRIGVSWFAVKQLPLFSAVALMNQSGYASEASSATPDLPAFIFESLYSSNQGSVYGVYESRHADLVLVQGGFDSGFQTGMVCRVVDSEGEIGEILLVEVRHNSSAALILDLEGGKIIEPGHQVRIKTVTF